MNKVATMMFAPLFYPYFDSPTQKVCDGTHTTAACITI